MQQTELNINSFFNRLIEEDSRHELIEAKNAFEVWFKEYREGNKRLEKHLGGMNALNLSELEATLILSYTARTSSWTNEHSRDSLKEDTDNFRKEHNSLLTEVLKKLPPYTQKKVYRMDFGSSANYKKELFYPWIENKIGKIIYVPYFWSTSKDKWDDELTWVINTSRNSKARDISNLTQNPNEEEVLFIPGANFMIDRVDSKNNLIFLTEIESLDYDIPLIGLYYLNY
jgi:hypothetical protein